MKLIPSVVYEFKSDAEHKLYELLRRIDFGSPAVALHSQNLSEHQYKKWCEIDFVLISEKGVLVLEVKGGRVSRDSEGIWTFTDRWGKKHRKSEGPFDQAREGMYALEKALGKALSKKTMKPIATGWAGVFTDINFISPGPEVPAEAVIDRGCCMDSRKLKESLQNLAEYWFRKKKHYQTLSPEIIDKIVQVLRPEFDLVPTLASRVNSIGPQMVSLTQDQYKTIEAAEDNDRLICTGGAGTGKSLIAVQTAISESLKGLSVEFICRSAIFAESVRERLERYEVRVNHLENIENNPEQQSDCLVVDEAQDMMTMDFLQLFTDRLEDGIEKGRWRFFMDSNNQVGVYGDYEKDAHEYLKNHSFSLKLTTNCRNTAQIIKQTQLMTGADIGTSRFEGDGEKVKSVKYESKEDCVALIVNQLNEWRNNDVSPEDIIILSGRTIEASCVNHLGKYWRNKLYVVDETNINSRPRGKIGFCEIDAFKGLERWYVMIVDLEQMSRETDQISRLYVALTRANAVLWVALPEEKHALMEEMKSENFQKMITNNASS